MSERLPITKKGGLHHLLCLLNAWFKLLSMFHAYIPQNSVGTRTFRDMIYMLHARDGVRNGTSRWPGFSDVKKQRSTYKENHFGLENIVVIILKLQLKRLVYDV